MYQSALDEKASQISLMGRIYKQALCTVAYLGEPELVEDTGGVSLSSDLPALRLQSKNPQYYAVRMAFGLLAFQTFYTW
jgi:hypothetical protein